MKRLFILTVLIVLTQFGLGQTMYLEQRGSSVLCWVEQWTCGQATAIYNLTGPGRVGIHWGAEYADSGNQWLWRQDNNYSVIRLHGFADGDVLRVTARSGLCNASAEVTLHTDEPQPEPEPDPCAICNYYPQLCPPECQEPEPPVNRYVYLENDDVEVRFDLRACGAVDWISLDGGPNLVDNDDNGRLVQVDLMPAKACCEDNSWPEIAHRRKSTPTQGGGYRQEPNWPLTYDITSDTFHAKCRMIEYWDPGSEATPYLLDWTVKLTDTSLQLSAILSHDESEPQRVEIATLWWYSDHFDQIPEFERWPIDRNFIEGNSIDLGSVKFSGEGRAIVAWVDETTGESSFETQRPDNSTLMTGWRAWPERTITKDESVEIRAAITFVPQDVEQPRLRIIRIEASLNALIRTLCADHGMDCDKYEQFLQEELEQ